MINTNNKFINAKLLQSNIKSKAEVTNIGAWFLESSQANREKIHVMFVLDTSGSMEKFGKSVLLNIIKAAKNKLSSTDYITVITYENTAEVMFSGNFEEFKKHKIEFYCGGGTQFKSALDIVSTQLKDNVSGINRNNTWMIFLTDGEDDEKEKMKSTITNFCEKIGDSPNFQGIGVGNSYDQAFFDNLHSGIQRNSAGAIKSDLITINDHSVIEPTLEDMFTNIISSTTVVSIKYTKDRDRDRDKSLSVRVIAADKHTVIGLHKYNTTNPNPNPVSEIQLNTEVIDTSNIEYTIKNKILTIKSNGKNLYSLKTNFDK